MIEMNHTVEFESIRGTIALNSLADDIRKEMSKRWPKVNFDASEWRINTHYQTTLLDVFFDTSIRTFESLDHFYILALRCIVGRMALEGKIKTSRATLKAWILLQHQAVPLFHLRIHHLAGLERTVVSRASPTSAATALMNLTRLGVLLDELARLKVIGPIGWSPSADTKASLRQSVEQWRLKAKVRKPIELLDRQIEGLSDATTAMLSNDERLSNEDRSAIAVANLLMCAPSRINEPLCMRVTDRYTIEEYAKAPDFDDRGKLFQAHQLLLMKGSKGADWTGKPILNFMIALADICWNKILNFGQRSRMLLKYYEENPARLYLPPDLEYLRGTWITKEALWKIINLSTSEPKPGDGVWNTLAKPTKDEPIAVVMIDNPRTHRSDGQRNTFSKIPALPWAFVEKALIKRVRERISAMRRVTAESRYEGPMSEMLMLVDVVNSPYLPQSWSGNRVRSRLKTPLWAARENCDPSVFIKLGIQITRGDTLVDCYIEPHDIRRWLTTKALDARERLSDALINKWANRLNISQLDYYDMRTSDQKAAQSSIPIPQELQSISNGLAALEGIEKEYGLSTGISVAHGDGSVITDIDSVLQATESRPVARSSNQIIILYPNRFGVCLHQHHETVCRAYNGCADGCNEQLTVKGHFPTNDEWRRREELNNRGIVNQLEALITARQRDISDDPATLDAHLLTLVSGTNVQTMAGELISRFHEIKDRIRDVSFRNELEAAFVSTGIVKRLDDPAIPGGSLIRYHNPSKHAAPGFERAIEVQLGGRQVIQQKTQRFYQEHPELSPMPLGLKDESHLIGDQADDEWEEDERAA